MLSNRNHVVQIVFRLLLAGLFILALGFERESPSASAEPQAEPMAAVPGGPGYVMVPAIAFLPEKSTSAYLVFWGELSVPQGSPDGYTLFNAPLYLPQGARLTGMTLFYRDNIDDSNTVGVDLMRKQLPGGGSGEGVGLFVYGNQIGLDVYQSDTTPDLSRAVIDNSQYVYWLHVYVYAAPVYLQLRAVRVDYTFDVAIPLVHR